MNWRRLLPVTLVLAATGCVPAKQMTVWAEYSRTGLIVPNAGRPRPAVRNWEDVKVYYLGSPEGFALKGNELQVVDGYDHVILGRLRIRWLAGHCNASAAANQVAVQNDTLKQLKAKAYDVGGNAVIYATSVFGQEVRTEAGYQTDCFTGAAQDNFGGGWVVILKPRAPPAPKPAADTNAI